MERRTFCTTSACAIGTAMLAGSGLAVAPRRDLAAIGRTGNDITLSAGNIAAFAGGLNGQLLRAGNAGYDTARKLWNGSFDPHPALIARCENSADILRCVNFARDHDLLVAVRGGGHSFAGHSGCDRGLMIDLALMRAVQVNAAARSVHVEPGALLIDVDRATLETGFVTSTGTISDTGVAGFVLGGGFGRLARTLGLACDNLVSARVVTADGRHLTASAEENPDLFWALRGGGGNFGVVTAFDFRVHPTPPGIVGGGIAYPLRRPREWLRAYADFAAGASEAFTGMLDIVQAPNGTRMALLDVCHRGDAATVERELAALRRLGPIAEDTVKPTPYLALQTRIDAHFPAGRGYYLKSGFLREVTMPFIDDLVDALEAAPARCLASILQLGGAISRVKPAATAYWHREARQQVLLGGNWDPTSDGTLQRDWVRSRWERIEPHTQGFYVNLLAPDDSSRRIQSTYGGNFDRLAALKQQYDPANFFRRNANIPPASSGGAP